VLVALIADVTRAYLDLRALQMQLAVLRKNIEVAQKYLDFVQERFSRGITNELDVTLAQRELAQFQAQLAPLTAQIDAARYVAQQTRLKHLADALAAARRAVTRHRTL
jgi:outer membrane protein TolC